MGFPIPALFQALLRPFIVCAQETFLDRWSSELSGLRVHQERVIEENLRSGFYANGLKHSCNNLYLMVVI